MIIEKIKNIFFNQNPLDGILSKKEYYRIKEIFRFQKQKIKLFGKDFHFSDSLGFLHSLEEIFKEGNYDFKSKNKEPYIIDAGANIGLSIIFFKKLYPNSKVVAFEPDPEIFKLLKENINSFGLNNIDLRNSATWVEDTKLEFYSEGSLAGSTEINFTNKSQKVLVKAERLKKWLSENFVDFLKIDIEGAENVLIFDLESELKNVEHLFLEYHSIVGKDQKLGEMLNMLSRVGFRYYIKSAADFVKRPFIERIESGFDLQLNIFCYRN